MRINAEGIKYILVVRNDRFGEFLLNIPALRALRQTFLNAKIIAVVNPYVRELAECLPYIDEIIEWPQGRHSLGEKIKLINSLKKKRIDIAILLNPSKEFNLFTFLAHIPVRAGYARKWGFLLTDKMKDQKYLGKKHEIDYNLDLAGLIGAKTEDKTLSMQINNGEVNALIREYKLEGCLALVAIHPWTSDPLKQWPLEKFVELAKLLSNLPYVKVVIVGGKPEEKISKDLFDGIAGENLVNITGKTTLRQLAAFLKHCNLLISADSGPVHLAGCVGTPVVAIFRKDIPGKSAARWGPRGEDNIVIQKDALSDISVDEVFEAVKKRRNWKKAQKESLL